MYTCQGRQIGIKVKITIIEEMNGTKIYRLENDVICAWINPADGMNLHRLCYKDTEVISFDKNRYESGAAYGIPVLFPTPNRTKDSRFIFEGREYPAEMHGIARKAPFKIEEAGAGKTDAVLTGSLRIGEKHPLYKEYPFLCTLHVSIVLREKGIYYNYEVLNQDERNMPFGFGLHPFFNKLDGNISIRATAKKVMEKDEQLIPNGRLLAVSNTPYDLSEGKIITNLSLDDVYTDMTDNPRAVLKYPDFKVDIEAGSTFTHIVVYTPENEPFFCIEPQTCSTNAINLYGSGEKSASGLSVLAPGEKEKGEAAFHFRELL